MDKTTKTCSMCYICRKKPAVRYCEFDPMILYYLGPTKVPSCQSCWENNDPEHCAMRIKKILTSPEVIEFLDKNPKATPPFEGVSPIT